MERLRQKRPRLVLKPEEYDQLRTRVLQRDGWKCQCCGISKNLHVHHLVHRSQLGSDETDNLITLCAGCHRRQHEKVLRRNYSFATQVRCWRKAMAPEPNSTNGTKIGTHVAEGYHLPDTTLQKATKRRKRKSPVERVENTIDLGAIWPIRAGRNLVSNTKVQR